MLCLLDTALHDWQWSYHFPVRVHRHVSQSPGLPPRQSRRHLVAALYPLLSWHIPAQKMGCIRLLLRQLACCNAPVSEWKRGDCSHWIHHYAWSDDIHLPSECGRESPCGPHFPGKVQDRWILAILDQFRGLLAQPALACGGKRSATPLWIAQDNERSEAASATRPLVSKTGGAALRLSPWRKAVSSSACHRTPDRFLKDDTGSPTDCPQPARSTSQ